MEERGAWWKKKLWKTKLCSKKNASSLDVFVAFYVSLGHRQKLEDVWMKQGRRRRIVEEEEEEKEEDGTQI